MKKWFIAVGVLVCYAALIWFVRSNDIARKVAVWICAAALAVFFLDWLVGQLAGLFSERLQEWCAAAILPIVAVLCVLSPLFIAVIVQ